MIFYLLQILFLLLLQNFLFFIVYGNFFSSIHFLILTSHIFVNVIILFLIYFKLTIELQLNILLHCNLFPHSMVINFSQLNEIFFLSHLTNYLFLDLLFYISTKEILPAFKILFLRFWVFEFGCLDPNWVPGTAGYNRILVVKHIIISISSPAKQLFINISW